MTEIRHDIDGKLSSLVDALNSLLGRWADDSGVEVKYHNNKPLLRFKFMTPDKFVVDLEYDINQTSEQYIDNMINGIRAQLFKLRRERHENPIVIH